MSDTYISGGSSGPSVNDLIDDIENPSETPDLSELLEKLTSLRDNSNLSTAGAENVQDIINQIGAGESPLAFNDPRDAINGGRGFLGDLGAGIDFVGSVVRSGINQIGQASSVSTEAFGDPLGLSDAQTNADGGIQTTQDRLADVPNIQGFLSGLSTGDDTVSGLDAFNLPDDFGPNLQIPLGPLSDLPVAGAVIPDRIPIPDLDTITNLGLEVATDPLSYLRAPGIVIDGASAATAASSRAGRFSQATVIARTGRAKGLSEDVLNSALSAVDEGGLVKLITDARNGVGGLTRQHLDDLGVQRGITFGGSVIPGSEGFAAALGAVRTGAVTGKLPRALERIGDSITQSAWTRFAKNLAENGATPLEVIDQANMAKAAVLASRNHINLAREAMAPYFANIAPPDLGEKELRELVERNTKEVLEKSDDATAWQTLQDDLTRFMDQEGITVLDLERKVGEEIAPIERFMAQENLATDSAILAPALAYGLVQLDNAARRFIGPPANGTSYTAAELLGDGVTRGVMNRQSHSLRAFMENVSTIEVFGNAARLDTVGDDLADSVFRLGNSVPDEVLDHFGVLADDLADNLDELDELTGASRSLIEASGDIPHEFERFIARSVDEAFDGLARGDLTAVRARLEGLVQTGTLHNEALDKLVRSITRGSGKAIRNADRSFGKANVRRAAAMSDKDLNSSVHQILKNEWFNPALARSDGDMFKASLIDRADRALILEAHTRNPAMIDGALGELRGWINEWTEVAQNTFTQYDNAFSPAIAEQLKNVDTFFHQTQAAVRVFGQAASEAANGIIDDVRAEAFTRRFSREEADELASQIMNNHANANAVGAGPGMWGSEMHEVSKFQRSLRREDFGKAVGVIGEVVTAANRGLFKPLALFGSGFIVRNFMGQIRLNFLQGVRTTGRGGYREFSPIYDTARRAIRDEAVNFAPPNSSAIWKEIPQEARAQAQELASSGVLTSGGVGGALEQAFELQEKSLGNALGSFEAFVGRQQTRIEQVVTPGLQGLTSGRVPEFNLNNVRNNVEGIQSSTRREIESYMRGALMWSNMRKGGTVSDGLNAVSKTHFDYWDLTSRGQKVDEFMPFWVFRSRITTLAASMALSSPGLAAQVFRLKQMNRDRDPYGAGQLDTWTFGAGRYQGVDWEFNPRDPLTEGFNTITSGLDAIQNPTEFIQGEVIEPLAPVIGLPTNSAFGTVTSFGEARGDRDLPARSESGLTARLAEWGADSPLAPILEASGALRMIDGEPVISKNGQEYLTSVVPILGTVERLLTEELQGEGSDLSQEEIDKRTLGAFFSFAGVPYTLISDKNRAGAVNAVAWDVSDYEKLVDQVAKFRESDNSQTSVDDLFNE